MKKKYLIGLSVILVLICVVLLVLQTKTDWSTDAQNYGLLNIMDSDETLLSNDFSFSYEISSPKDLVVLNNMSITQGEVKVTVTLNDKVILDETFEAGEYVVETDKSSDVTGNVIIEVNPSDDVKGTYSIKINTRQKRLYKFKQSIKENLL